MEKVFSVEEAQIKLYTALADAMDFKYLKSQRCLKKTVKNLIFEVDFFSSKWNRSGERVDIEATFVIMNKQYGKGRVNCVIADKSFKPGVESGYWYDISTPDALDATFKKLKEELAPAVDLYMRFENDYVSATEYLFTELFEEYHVYLDFVAEILGIDRIREKAKEIYSDIPKEEVLTYQKIADEINFMLKKGDMRCLRTEGLKNWMINRCNRKYVIDNKLY